MMQQSLTAKQFVAALLDDLYYSTGYPVSVRQIVRACEGRLSIATVHSHLRKLESDGLVKLIHVEGRGVLGYEPMVPPSHAVNCVVLPGTVVGAGR